VRLRLPELHLRVRPLGLLQELRHAHRLVPHLLELRRDHRRHRQLVRRLQELFQLLLRHHRGRRHHHDRRRHHRHRRSAGWSHGQPCS